MVKSFKKVIASLLAVLMVVCAMPFTAFAVVGEETPDIQLLFNPVYIGGYFNYAEALAADSLFDYTMLQEAPITYDYKYDEETGSVSGTLTLEAAKTQPLADSLGEDGAPLEEDTQLGVGDYFAVTVAMKDCPSIYALMYGIGYSANIEPAGTYSVTKSRKAYQGLAGISDGKNITVGGETSAVGSYYAGLNDGVAGDVSKINVEERYIDGSVTIQNGGTKVDTTVVTPGENVYTNPATGEVGYTFENLTLCSTYIFKIVDEGPISFSMADPKNAKLDYSGGALVSDSTYGKGMSNYTTYAIQDGAAGSGKMTFMGGNINTGVKPDAGEPETHEHTYATEWSKNKTHHWHAATCGHDTEKSGYAEHSYTSEETTAATCTTPGVTTYTCECGDTYTEEIPAATGHKYATTWSSDENQHWHAATCGHNVKSDEANHAGGTATCTAKAVCSTCGASYGELAEHSFTTKASEIKATDATCTAAATYYVQCDYCDAVTEEATVPVGQPNGHSYTTKASTSKATDATCTAAATYYVQCNNCTEVSDTVTVPVGDPIAHSFTTKASSQVASSATCTEAETRFVQCDNCTAVDTTKTVSVGKAKGHSFKNYVSNNDATPAKDGTKTATCDNGCGTTDTIADEGTATGVNVTVKNTYDSFGSAAYGTTNYAFGDTVTLTAKAHEDCEFVGWQIADKIVKTEETYTFEATVDVTVTPVFRPVDADKISVIFYDKYMNVIASYMNVTVADFQAAMATKIPTAPVYAGYKFAGYSYTDAEILALDESATIVAYYNEDKAQGFTVETTADATITVDAKRGTKESDQKYVDVMFDTQATVTASGATAWKVDDAIVGYGESYTFFVGSDIMLEPVFEAVEATPAVAMVKAYKIAADSHKIMFLASMNIPAGYKLVDHGFVYGKNMTAADLVLDNEGNNGALPTSGVVKKTSAGTNTVEQFGISYGITKQTGKACAAAYLTFAKDGVITTIYSDAVAYDYDNSKTIIIMTGADD